VYASNFWLMIYILVRWLMYSCCWWFFDMLMTVIVIRLFIMRDDIDYCWWWFGIHSGIEMTAIEVRDCYCYWFSNLFIVIDDWPLMMFCGDGCYCCCILSDDVFLLPTLLFCYWWYHYDWIDVISDDIHCIIETIVMIMTVN